MRKSAIIILVFLLIFFAGIGNAADVTFAWDANIEDDLAGYKLYHGSVSRSDASAAIETWCREHEAENENCVDQWKAICKEEPACHSKLFDYGGVVDVGNVVQYTLTDLADGPGFYAATAYDNNGNESNFSDELSLVINTSKPEAPQNFKATIKASRIIVEVNQE